MKKFGNYLAFVPLFLMAIFMSIGCVVSCGATKNSSDNVKPDTMFVATEKHDTLIIEHLERIDSLLNQLQKSQDSIRFYRDSVEYKNYINARRIEKIKYYINICNKNTKNKKYFFGWIKRTMSE